jgi:DNA polymerase-3 subunit epsilon
MTGGQGALALSDESAAHAAERAQGARVPVRAAVPLRVMAASAEELLAHETMLALITKVSGGRCVWAQSETREESAAARALKSEPQRSSA